MPASRVPDDVGRIPLAIALPKERPSRPGRAYIFALRLYQVCSGAVADPILTARRIQEAPSFVANLLRYTRAGRDSS